MKNLYKGAAIAIVAMLTCVTLNAQVTAPLDDGGYLIRIKESTGLIDNTGYPGSNNPNVGGWYPQASVWQRWMITQIADGYYRIESILADSAIISVDGASNDDEANIIQSKWEDSDHQKWEIQDLENGSYKVLSKGSGKAWHAKNPNNADHPIARNIVQIGSYDNASQEFEFIPTADSVLSGPYESGKSYIIASECTQMVMTEDPLVTDTGNLVQKTFVDDDNQKWQLDWVEDVTDGDITTKYYKLTNRASELVLTLADTTTKDGVNVITAPWSDDAEAQKFQMWGVEPVVGVQDQNQVNVFSRMNAGRTIEIQGGPQWNEGHNLTTWWRFENTQEWERWQRWRFVMTNDPTLRAPQIDFVKKSLQVYPNPATESCKIIVPASKGIGSISLFDISGKEIKTSAYEFMEGRNELELNLDYISNGLYLIRVSLPNNHQLVSKVLIQN